MLLAVDVGLHGENLCVGFVARDDRELQGGRKSWQRAGRAMPVHELVCKMFESELLSDGYWYLDRADQDDVLRSRSSHVWTLNLDSDAVVEAHEG